METEQKRATTRSLEEAQMNYLRASIPLPIADNAGVKFPQADIKWFERQLLGISSGFRKHLWVWGAWDGDGTPNEEPVTTYVVTIKANQLDKLKALLNDAGAIFRQRAILCELHAVDMILLTDFEGKRIEYPLAPQQHTSNGK